MMQLKLLVTDPETVPAAPTTLAKTPNVTNELAQPVVEPAASPRRNGRATRVPEWYGIRK